MWFDNVGFRVWAGLRSLLGFCVLLFMGFVDFGFGIWLLLMFGGFPVSCCFADLLFVCWIVLGFSLFVSVMRLFVWVGLWGWCCVCLLVLGC